MAPTLPYMIGFEVVVLNKSTQSCIDSYSIKIRWSKFKFNIF